MELFSSDAVAQRAHDTSSEIKVYFIVVQMLLYIYTKSPLWQRKFDVFRQCTVHKNSGLKREYL